MHQIYRVCRNAQESSQSAQEEAYRESGSHDTQQAAWRNNERDLLARILVSNGEPIFWYCPKTEPSSCSREDALAEIPDVHRIRANLFST